MPATRLLPAIALLGLATAALAEPPPQSYPKGSRDTGGASGGGAANLPPATTTPATKPRPACRTVKVNGKPARRCR